jgi:hypothetical protein
VTNWKPRRRSFWQGRGGVAVDVVLVLAVLALGAAVLVPKLRPANAADPAAASAAGTPGPSTASATPDPGAAGGVDVTLDDITFERGHCYTWDQKADLRTAPEDVACARPHLFEAVSSTAIRTDQYPAGTAYPNEDVWGRLTGQYCAEPATSFLGRQLDPDGLYAVGLIRPTEDSWDQGTRSVTCGLERRSLAARQPAGLLETFTGDILGADQSRVYPTGSCLAEDTAQILGTVACSAPHQAVAVGSITLPAGPGYEAPTADQFTALAAPRCLDRAKAFFGAAYHDSATARTGWLRIMPASWNAGSRSFTCTVDYTTADGVPRTVTGPPNGTPA